MLQAGSPNVLFPGYNVLHTTGQLVHVANIVELRPRGGLPPLRPFVLGE